ncbi:MAG: cobalamin biosynthesis protein CobG [Jhaorihella sp.]
MSAPVVKGWCPGAHRPMMSGDGLVFRVRPFLGELSAAQALGLCDLATKFGNGVLDLTSRANLQIRGVSETDQAALLTALDALGLLDADPAVEGHRNILMPLTWDEGDLTYRLYKSLLATLPHLPDLPDKMGFAIDTGRDACLRSGSADFRFELGDAGGLILRLDGSETGRAIVEANAMDALLEMANWFVRSGGPVHGRMARHIPHVAPPALWCAMPPRHEARPATLGPAMGGTVLGAPFGKIPAGDLRALIENSGATHLRPMLDRMLYLKGANIAEAEGFVTRPTRLMQVHACPGAPFCPQASVETIALAKQLAHRGEGVLHVSGCTKGCAHPRLAAMTLVGANGKLDLVRNGAPWDAPDRLGLTLGDVKELFGRI